MNTEQYESFRVRLAESPNDQATRLVFADFLEENDREEEAMLHRAWTPEKQKKAEYVMDAIIKYGGHGDSLWEVVGSIQEHWNEYGWAEVRFHDWDTVNDHDCPSDDEVLDAIAILTGDPTPVYEGNIKHMRGQKMMIATCPC